jgi:hypothetical protein
MPNKHCVPTFPFTQALIVLSACTPRTINPFPIREPGFPIWPGYKFGENWCHGRFNFIHPNFILPPSTTSKSVHPEGARSPSSSNTNPPEADCLNVAGGSSTEREGSQKSSMSSLAEVASILWPTQGLLSRVEGCVPCFEGFVPNSKDCVSWLWAMCPVLRLCAESEGLCVLLSKTLCLANWAACPIPKAACLISEACSESKHRYIRRSALMLSSRFQPCSA